MLATKCLTRSISVWLILGAAVGGLVGCGESMTAAEHYANALELRDAKKRIDAALEFKNALRLEPSDADIRIGLAELYLEMSIMPLAEKEIRKAWALGRQDPETFVILAKTLAARSAFHEIIDTAADQPWAGDPAVAAQVALAYLDLDQRETAQTIFDAAAAEAPDNVEVRLAAARFAFAVPDIEQAKVELEKVLALDETVLDAIIMLGDVAAYEGDFEGARSRYRSGVDLVPENPLARGRLVRVLLELGEAEAAKRNAKKILRIAGGDLAARYYLAESEYRLGNTDDAVTVLREVLRRDSNYPAALLLLGTIEYKAGKINQADEHLSAYFAQVKTRDDARLLLATIKLELDAPEQAVKVLTEDRTTPLKNPVLLATLANAYLENDDFEAAAKQAELAVLGAPDSAPIRTRAGIIKVLLGQPEGAVSDLTHAVEVDPKFTQSKFTLAHLYLRTGEYAKALAIAEELAKENPDLPVYRSMAGVAYELQNDFDNARASYDAAVDIDPDYRSGHLSLARLDAKLGNTDAAISRLRAVIKADPEFVPALELLAKLEEKEGDSGLATSRVEEARQANPDSLRARVDLADRYMNAGRIEDAMREIEAAFELAPRHPEVMLVRTRGMLLTGQVREALDSAESLAAARPQSPRSYYWLGRARQAAGDRAGAIEAFKRGTELDGNSALLAVSLANLQIETGDASAALETARKLEKQGQSTPELELVIASAQLAGRDPDGALNTLNGIASDAANVRRSVAELSGQAYEAQGKATAARESYEQARQFDPQSSAALKGLVRLDLAAKDADAARHRLRSYISANPANVEAMLLLGALEAEAGHQDASVELAERARKASATALAPRLVLGDLYLKQARFAKALEVADEAMDIAPKHPVALSLRSRSLFASGDARKALAVAETLAKAYPDAPDGHLLVARINAASGNMDEARKSLETVLKNAPEHLGALLQLGQIQLRTGSLDEASETAEAAKKAHPEEAGAHLLAGDVLLTKRLPEEALREYGKANERRPDSITVGRIASAHLKAGGSDEARKVLAAWLQDHPDDNAVRNMLAGIQFNAGDRNAAVAEMKSIIEKDPENWRVASNLALALDDMRDGDAVVYAKQAYESAPSEAHALDTYGWLLVKGGKIEQGISLLGKARELAPENPTIRYHLAVGFVRSADTLRAKKLLQELIEEGPQFADKDAAERLLKTLN